MGGYAFSVGGVFSRLVCACNPRGSSAPILIGLNTNFGTVHAVHRPAPAHPWAIVNPHPDPAGGSAVHRVQLPPSRKDLSVPGDRPS